jgi:hypothetical protein
MKENGKKKQGVSFVSFSLRFAMDDVSSWYFCNEGLCLGASFLKGLCCLTSMKLQYTVFYVQSIKLHDVSSDRGLHLEKGVRWKPLSKYESVCCEFKDKVTK